MFKDKKTTYIGIAAFLGFIVTILLVFFEKASLNEAGGYLGMYAAFLITILGLLSRDSKRKTETEDNDATHQ